MIGRIRFGCQQIDIAWGSGFVLDAIADIRVTTCFAYLGAHMKDKLGGRFGYWAFRDLRASYGFARIQGDLSEVLTEAAEGVRW